MDPFELMQSCMQVSMVEDDKPLELENDNDAANDDNATQSPETELKLPKDFPSMYISNEEMAYYNEIYKELESVKTVKIHCTSCNQHLGSAPIDQKQRHEHPLLKVIVCGSCREFYLSGDFVQDEDGSELYCRWCGEGGQVYCCANCPFVFCKRCIRRNINQDMVTHIENSDDWVCFACDPKDIWFLRAQYWAIKEYSAMKIKESSGEDFDIFQDCTLCCNKGSRPRKVNSIPPPAKVEQESEEKKRRKRKATSSPITMNASKLAKLLTDIPPMVPRPTLENTEPVVSPQPLPRSDVISVDDSPPASPSSKKSITAKKISTKTFLQVKPTSALLQPKPPQENSAVNSPLPPPLIVPPSNFQNHPIIMNMIFQMQKQLRPGDQPKLIKVASPDGRVCYIDPMKVPRIETAPINSNPLVGKQLWLDNTIQRTTEISQFISNQILEMAKCEYKVTTDHFEVYTNCQTRFKNIMAKFEEAVKKLEEEYHSWFLNQNKIGKPIQIVTTLDHNNQVKTTNHTKNNNQLTIDLGADNKNVTSSGINAKATGNTSEETTDSDNVQRLKRKLLKLEKALNNKNSKSEKKKRKEPHVVKETADEIFDCDVTCDSDNSLSDYDDNESILSINSSDSASDCVILNNDIDNEIHCVDSPPPQNGKSSIDDSKGSSRNSPVNAAEATESANEKNEEKTSEQNEDKETADKSIKDTTEEESINKGSTEEVNNEQPTELENCEDNSSLLSLIDGKIVGGTDEEHLMSIAQAIRDSLIESKAESLQPNDDLEKLLDSNIVCRTTKNDKEKSFVDAFSNFVASGSDSLPVHPTDTETEEICADKNSFNGDEETTDLLNESNFQINENLENKIGELQKLAENCIQDE